MTTQPYGMETSRGAAAAGLAISMGVPLLLIVWGIAALGLDAIDWVGAIVWGLLATVAFTLAGLIGRRTGMTDLDIVEVLGSTVADPGSGEARSVGALLHLVNGAVLAVAWVYTVGLLGLEATWVTALGWAVVLAILALVMLSSIGPFHPAVRAGKLREPGLAGMNFGRMTPAGSLMGHLVYGLVLGLGYQFLSLT